MTSRALNSIRERVQGLVSLGFRNYDQVASRPTLEYRRNHTESVVVELVLRVLDRISEQQSLSVFPLKPAISELVFLGELQTNDTTRLVREVFDVIIQDVKSTPGFSVELARQIDTYSDLIIDVVKDSPEKLGISGATEALKQVEQYGYASSLGTFSTKTSASEGKVYTLWPKERGWEEFAQLDENTSYTPLGYNRFARVAGLPQYQVTLEYKDTIVRNGEILKLNSLVSTPSRNKFNSAEWETFESKLFNKANSFSEAYKQSINNLYDSYLREAFEINGIISDSRVETYPSTPNINEEELVNTFAGEGKSIYSLTRQLGQLADAFGGYEGSSIGGFDYISKYTEYLLSCAYGRNIGGAAEGVLERDLFGDFSNLFDAISTDSSIPGLAFLKDFSKLKSFAHGQTVPKGATIANNKVTYNPLLAEFMSGVEDFYVPSATLNSYSEPPRVDLLLYGIETLYRTMLSIGDNVKGVINSLSEKGTLPGYEGLGSIEVQMLHLQTVFPPSSYFVGQNNSFGAGLTSAIKSLLNSYSRFSQTMVYSKFPSTTLGPLLEWVYVVNTKIEQLLSVMESIGISKRAYIPNISYKNFQFEQTKLVSFLRGLGFRDSEINNLLEVQSFEELVRDFAPMSDSADLKSFFKAYELAQLIYEFGGDSAISAYLGVLYSKDSVESLLGILELSSKSKSKVTSYQLSKYPRLIGLLLGLTYALDPSQLIKFNRILGGNNLSLLESVQKLLQAGESNILSSPEQINLLVPVVEQIARGGYAFSPDLAPDLNYEQVNKTAPIALKQWTQVISRNLGNLSRPLDIEDLYDKSIGLTPKELLSVLNYPSSINPLGVLVDGFSGGEFSSFLKYANIAGLGVKLGYYKNSNQAPNFKTNPNESSFGLVLMLESMRSASKTIKSLSTIFENSLALPSSSITPSSVIDVLTFAQNKTFGAFALIFNEVASIPLGFNQASTTLLREVGDFEIIEPPGIGNSRLPNRIPATNTVTPEQAEILLSGGGQVLPALSSDVLASLNPAQIAKFIKFSEPNTLASSGSFTDSTRPFTPNPPAGPSALAPFLALSRVEFSVPKSYSAPTIYSSTALDTEIANTGAPGANFLRLSGGGSESVSTLVPIFDRVRSCARFGGQSCGTIYLGPREPCKERFSKALYSEDYITIPGSKVNTVYIDRPLGTFADYKPVGAIIPTTSYASPPAMYSLLPDSTSIGEKAEPLVLTTSKLQKPIVFEKGNGAVSEYNSTEFSMVEFIRAKLERNSEFECAAYSSPFHYQVCMNIMKCKRFVPGQSGEYYLDFCPRTLSGGRLRP